MSDSIKVYLKDGSVHDGICYCVDKVSRTLVLKLGNSFLLFTEDQIAKIDGSCVSACVDEPALIGFNSVHTVEKREQIAMADAEKRLSALNFNVAPSVQLLYEKLMDIYPCRWDENNNIIILESFRIEAPYTNVEHVNKNNADEAGLTNLMRMLTGIRRKYQIQ